MPDESCHQDLADEVGGPEDPLPGDCVEGGFLDEWQG
jgi:hypothetical protein